MIGFIIEPGLDYNQDNNLLREENIKLRAKNDVLRELAGLKRKEE